MVICKLNAQHRSAFDRMLTDFETSDSANGPWYATGRKDFETYVQRLIDDELGVNLPSGIVPCSHRWLMSKPGEIVGIVRVRHNLNNPYLLVEAGHIGYDVPPSHRGKGYGVACLRAGLGTARELGIAKVLVCADSGNEASWRTIERCGGVFESEPISKHDGKPLKRYWIETAIS